MSAPAQSIAEAPPGTRQWIVHALIAATAACVIAIVIYAAWDGSRLESATLRRQAEIRVEEAQVDAAPRPDAR